MVQAGAFDENEHAEKLVTTLKKLALMNDSKKVLNQGPFLLHYHFTMVSFEV
ncbi:hypothetical protein JOC74_001809 [Bacillus capparidis]|uniref:Uncharacterized protein n=1 Tax=Bacillus capparidis TaxID=1840411 RepID=A0ABS4CUW3_9BACI|nr:hypothetical protein [Bacillus capparidis]